MKRVFSLIILLLCCSVAVASEQYRVERIEVDEHWSLDRAARLDVEIVNCGDEPLDMLLYVVGDGGWDAVAASSKIAVGARGRLSCNLREAFEDGTPKLNPEMVSHIELITVKPKPTSRYRVETIEPHGTAPKWRNSADRLVIPSVEECAAEAGRRVRYQLGVLYLPRDWQEGRRYPLIVELPGNIFYTRNCYSTGLPDQCKIGYGMSCGEGVIWLSLPFVKGGEVAPSGWGDGDETADYVVQMVEQMCERFGADPDRVVLTGFSRGAIACGYIGLRNDRISSLWCGIHPCQHFDGDGWRGAKMEGAVQRLQRGQSIPQFHTDNDDEALHKMLREGGVTATFATSNLGAHACAMFLDNRESTLQLRRWFREVTSK